MTVWIVRMTSEWGAMRIRTFETEAAALAVAEEADDNGHDVEVYTEDRGCPHESITTADGHGAFCKYCGDTLA